MGLFRGEGLLVLASDGTEYHHPGDNLEANCAFLKSTPIRLYCESQYISLEVDLRKLRVTSKLPTGWSGDGVADLGQAPMQPCDCLRV